MSRRIINPDPSLSAEFIREFEAPQIWHECPSCKKPAHGADGAECLNCKLARSGADRWFWKSVAKEDRIDNREAIANDRAEAEEFREMLEEEREFIPVDQLKEVGR